MVSGLVDNPGTTPCVSGVPNIDRATTAPERSDVAWVRETDELAPAGRYTRWLNSVYGDKRIVRTMDMTHRTMQAPDTEPHHRHADEKSQAQQRHVGRHGPDRPPACF